MSDTPTLDDAAAPSAADALAPLGASWQEQDAQLRDLWIQNKTPQEISEVLNRSVPAIMTRAARLGLPRRSAPGRKPGSGVARRFDALTKKEPESKTERGQASETSAAVLRICLMCLRKFPSEGRHNRICSPCKGTSEYSQAMTLPDAHLPEA